jgi:dipeptidyl aminopeptidase/acylaminoacyl peptidase
MLAPHWRLDAIYATERPHHPAVSPDGSQIAFVLSSGSESDIYMVSTSGGQARRLTTDRSLASFWEDSGPEWSPDGSRIAYTSGDHTYVIPADGGTPQRIPETSLGTWLDDDRLVVVVERKRTTRLALVDTTDPWPQPFGPKGGDVSQVRRTNDGRVVATLWPKDDRNRSDIVLAQPDDWVTLAGHPDRRALDAVSHGDEIAYVLEEGDWRAVYRTDIGGKEHRLLAKDDADFSDLDWAPDGQRLTAIRSHRGQGDLVTIDFDGKVTVLGEGGFWQTPRWSNNGIVAVHEDHETAPRLVLVTEDLHVSILYDGAPAAIAAAPHAPFERVVFPSSDGMEVEGFLFKPADVSNPVPAVVYPHGGPTSVYGDEWDGHAQYFIDKGYAWLAINFRGSTTYGVAFERANHDDWGIGDAADCIAAGRFLKGLEWVDEERLAIFGASYGSYMALASLVHDDSPFACGVAKYGDCNILTSWAQGDRPGGDDLERMMGHPSSNREAYRAGSPIHEVDNLDRPILIGHGEKDARVHLNQAHELVAELERLGKRYEYVTYPEEGHGFLRRPSQIDFYRRLERFLDWYLM